MPISNKEPSLRVIRDHPCCVFWFLCGSLYPSRHHAVTGNQEQWLEGAVSLFPDGGVTDNSIVVESLFPENQCCAHKSVKATQHNGHQDFDKNDRVAPREGLFSLQNLMPSATHS